MKDKHIEAQTELQRPFKKFNFSFKIPDNVWQFFHYDMGRNLINVLIFVAIVVFTAIYATKNTSTTKKEKISFTEEERKNKLHESFKRYQKITPNELLFTFFDIFDGCKYKRDGDPKKNQYDCVSSFEEYLKDRGSNIKRKTPMEYKKIFDYLVREGVMKRRWTLRQVKTGDYILIQLKPGQPSHIGFVRSVTPRGHIEYTHVGGKELTASVDYEPWGSRRINSIHGKESYVFWAWEFDEKEI